MLLVGDVGGTKVHLAIYDQDKCIKEEKFPSRHFQSLEEIIEKFLDQKVDQACFALAGPVQNNLCKVTNLHWEIDGERIGKKFGIGKVHLLNDLEASAWGIAALQPKDLETIHQGQQQSGNRAVVAAGTGLGISALYWDGKNHYPFATEAGHVDFAPRDSQDEALLKHLRKKYGHVSAERVVSGQGLEHLYWFLVEKKNSKNSLEGEEIPKLIIEHIDEIPLCKETAIWFAVLYGMIVGNAALQYLATGGVYLAGGLAPKLLKILKSGEFMRAYADKGRFKELLLTIPVYVVMNENLPLLGALHRCQRADVG